MLAQKYRPHRFTDVVGQQLIRQNLMAQSKRNLWSQVYILGGQFGSGKTTLARIIAMAVNCHHKDENGNPCGKCPSCRAILNGDCSDILEIDAASNTGVDNVRKLIELSDYAPMAVDKRVFIIDEVHRLSPAAFESLLKLLEEPPQHCIFVLATTDVEKIPRTVQSRACRYTFGRIPEELISEHLGKVARVENINITKGACDAIARSSDGALRNAMMLLERVSFSGTQIDEESVLDMIGTTDERKVCGLLSDMASFDREALIRKVHDFALVGKNFYTLSGEMLDVAGDLIIRSCGGNVTASEGYLSALDRFTGGVEMRAKLAEYLLELREGIRDNASESYFLALSLRVLSRLEEEYAPERRISTKEEEQIEDESYRKETEKAEPEETVDSFTPMSFDFDDDDDFQTPYTDPFDALNRDIPEGPAENGFSSAESSDEVPFDTDTVISRENGTVELKGCTMPVEVEEFTDDGVDYPKEIRSVRGLTFDAVKAAVCLRRACSEDPVFLNLLKDAFRIEPYSEGISLETDDNMAFKQMAIFAREHDFENVEFVLG